MTQVRRQLELIVMCEFTCDVIYGHSELKHFDKFENGRMVHYSYRIDFDRFGNVVKQTEPEAQASIGWSDGSEFTEGDYKRLYT